MLRCTALHPFMQTHINLLAPEKKRRFLQQQGFLRPTHHKQIW
jgi:hypothetical protein